MYYTKTNFLTALVIDQIRINFVVRELGKLLISGKFRPMFQNPSVGVNGSVRQCLAVI